MGHQSAVPKPAIGDDQRRGQRPAIPLEQAVIADPDPFPPTAGGRSCGLDLPPQPYQHLPPQTLQTLAPFPLGPGPQEAARQVRAPAAYPAQRMVAAASKHRGETSAQRVGLRVAAGPAGAIGVPQRESRANPRQRWPAPEPPGHAAPGLAAAGAARALSGDAVWPVAPACALPVGRACGILGRGARETPPSCGFTAFLPWGRP
jgi:hypothetical protein